MAAFTGIWKLDKYESFDAATHSWKDAQNRQGYTGFLLYDGMGHMGVQLLPPGFKDFDNSNSIDSLTNDELKKRLQLHSSIFAYFANCDISKDTIEHHKLLSNNPAERGTTVKRNFEFKGDTLLLTAVEAIGGLQSRLRWVKQ